VYIYEFLNTFVLDIDIHLYVGISILQDIACSHSHDRYHDVLARDGAAECLIPILDTHCQVHLWIVYIFLVVPYWLGLRVLCTHIEHRFCNPHVVIFT
jgi:hypothetical protein